MPAGEGDDLSRLFKLPPAELASLIAALLVQVAGTSEERGTLTRFQARSLHCLPPLQSYLCRLAKFLPARRDSLFLMLVYMRRLACANSVLEIGFVSMNKEGKKRHSRPRVNKWTVHRLVLASLMVASKFISDAFIQQSRVAKAGGIAVEELLSLEVELLAQLQFNLMWTDTEYATVSRVLLDALDACKLENQDKSCEDRPCEEKMYKFDIPAFLAVESQNKVLQEKPVPC